MNLVWGRRWNSDWNSRHSFCYNPFLLHDSSVSPAKLQEDNVIPRIPLCLHLLLLRPPVFSVCFWLTMICKAFGICKARTLDYSERRMEGRKRGKGRPKWYLEKVKNILEALCSPPKISIGHSFSSRSLRSAEKKALYKLSLSCSFVTNKCKMFCI